MYLENVAPKSKRLTRWSLELAEYDKEIIYKKGSSNTNADALSRMFEENAVIETAIELDDIIKYQESDSFLSSKKTMMRTKGVSSLGKYEIEDGIVYRQETRNKKDSRRLAVPEKLKETVLNTCHEDLGGGHFGFKKTFGKIKQRYFWHGMYKDTENWVNSCSKCSARKSPQPNRQPLMPINKAKRPFEMVGIDILGPLPETLSGNKYILVITDYLTR